MVAPLLPSSCPVAGARGTIVRRAHQAHRFPRRLAPAPQKTVSSRLGSIAGPRAAKEQPQCACICTCCICVPPFVREQPPPSPAARHDGNHASTRWKKPQPGSTVTRRSCKRHCCRASGAGAASNESPGRTSVPMSGIGRNKHPAAGSERGVAARGGVPVLPGASPGGQRT